MALATTEDCSSCLLRGARYDGREFAEFAWQATREQQITVANRVLEDVGWGAWPTCSRRLGLR